MTIFLNQNVEAVGVIIHRNETWMFLMYLYGNGLVEHSFYKPKESLKIRVAGHTCAKVGRQTTQA
jgi:hypothetical protein